MTRSDWGEIERAYLPGENLRALALRFHVSRRQVATKAREGAWTARRAAEAPHGPAAVLVEPEPCQAMVVEVIQAAASDAVVDEEPTWVLRARDRYAVAALQHIASQLELVGGDRAVVLAARATAQAMLAWSRRQKRPP